MSNTFSGVEGNRRYASNAKRPDLHNISVKDVVDTVLKKNTWGIEDYNPKAMVKDLLPVHTHVRAKQKRRMFCEEASRRADKIPAPSKYQSTIDWDKNPETKTAKFFTDKRMMQADEIIKRSKVKEKSSPGPTGYDDFDSWKWN